MTAAKEMREWVEVLLIDLSHGGGILIKGNTDAHAKLTELCNAYLAAAPAEPRAADGAGTCPDCATVTDYRAGIDNSEFVPCVKHTTAAAAVPAGVESYVGPAAEASQPCKTHSQECPAGERSRTDAHDLPFDTVRNVVRALVRLGCSAPESHEEQAARAVELTNWLCREVQSFFDRPPAPMGGVTEAMVNRFLSWPLPDSVHTDGTYPAGDFRKKFTVSLSGTNLLDATQARAMLEHVLQAPPAAQAQDAGELR